MLTVKNKDTTTTSLDANGYICHIFFKLLSYSPKNALKDIRDLFLHNLKVANKIKSNLPSCKNYSREVRDKWITRRFHHEHKDILLDNTLFYFHFSKLFYSDVNYC